MCVCVCVCVCVRERERERERDVVCPSFLLCGLSRFRAKRGHLNLRMLKYTR